MGAPYLMLCSENDDLAPFHIIHNFAQRLRELGADVKLVKWNGSPHVGLFLNLFVSCLMLMSFVISSAETSWAVFCFQCDKNCVLNLVEVYFCCFWACYSSHASRCYTYVVKFMQCVISWPLSIHNLQSVFCFQGFPLPDKTIVKHLAFLLTQ